MSYFVVDYIWNNLFMVIKDYLGKYCLVLKYFENFDDKYGEIFGVIIFRKDGDFVNDKKGFYIFVEF